MKYGDQLHYAEDARSVHVLLRITDEDTGKSDDVLIDNLTSAIQFIVEHDLRIWQELIGFATSPTAEQLGGGMQPGDMDALKSGDVDESSSKRIVNESLAAWREHASGPGDDALVIDCYGDPALLASNQNQL